MFEYMWEDLHSSWADHMVFTKNVDGQHIHEGFILEDLLTEIFGDSKTFQYNSEDWYLGEIAVSFIIHIEDLHESWGPIKFLEGICNRLLEAFKQGKSLIELRNCYLKGGKSLVSIYLCGLFKMIRRIG